MEMSRFLYMLAAMCIVSACKSQPTINTIAIPESALAVRPVPVLEGPSNEAMGIYGTECKAALDKREDDIEAIRKAVAP